jgi:hypothetical protein
MMLIPITRRSLRLRRVIPLDAYYAILGNPVPTKLHPIAATAQPNGVNLKLTEISTQAPKKPRKALFNLTWKLA